jgi:hypothetical protein
VLVLMLVQCDEEDCGNSRDNGLNNLYSEPGAIRVVSLIFSVVIELREHVDYLNISNASHQLHGLHSF